MSKSCLETVPSRRKHRVLLDLPVRTDTKGVGRGYGGSISDPRRLVRCDVCGWALRHCRCLAGKDY